MGRALILAALLAAGSAAAMQRVVDRIVARVEGDILTLSEVRELGRFQQLVEGRAAPDEKLLGQLIEQWIVASEAEAARFPKPAQAEVDRELERLQQQLGSAEALRSRMRELELTGSMARRLLARQLWLARYLDYKFRPAAQVEEAEIERYYRGELTPQLLARGRAVPPLDQVREPIREVLIQREVSARASRWLDETRSRLRIEIEPGGAAP
jgi:parvulin-like peptidyl-prolyl isomerase